MSMKKAKSPISKGRESKEYRDDKEFKDVKHKKENKDMKEKYWKEKEQKDEKEIKDMKQIKEVRFSSEKKGKKKLPVIDRPHSPVEHPYKHSSSKYDFVKVRVWLSSRHYYVLSRFLISRVLTAIKVDYAHAIRIALDLKKELVDKEALNLSHEEMENDLFKLLRNFNYTDETIKLYKMFTSFHHQRIPLVILVGGTACTGKSSLAAQLAERLNLSSVLKTGIICDMVHNIMTTSGAYVPPPVKFSPFTSAQSLISQYEEECKLVKKGLEAELNKCFKEGKSIIIEGFHIHPTLYSDMIQESRRPFEHPEDRKEEGEGLNGDDLPKTFSIKSIVISFLVTLEDQRAHTELVENWISQQSNSNIDRLEGETSEEKAQNCLLNFRCIQDYLLENKNEFKQVPINVRSATDTLEEMHTIVLDYMQSVFEKSLLLNQI